MSSRLRLSEAQFAALTGVKSKTKSKRPPRSNVRGERTIGGKTYKLKSLYEINYCHYLEFLKQNKEIKDWEYEPRVFSFPKDAYRASPFYYCPDFKVTTKTGKETYTEVKGWMCPESKKKIKRFRKHYPDLPLTVVDSAWFNSTGKQLKAIIPGWESLPKKSRFSSR